MLKNLDCKAENRLRIAIPKEEGEDLEEKIVKVKM
jgi:hypothetical protein